MTFDRRNRACAHGRRDAASDHLAEWASVAVPVTGAAYPRASVTWYEDGKPTCGPDGPAGKLRDCEQALRRAGFHVEYTTEATAGCLLAWRRTQTR
jgi:hypothetical protein